MKLNLTNGFIGAAALVAVGAIAGHFIHVGPFTGQPYPPDSGCNGVAWNSNSSAANSYKIVFATPSGSSITVMVDFTWDYTPGYHHNVAMPAGNTFDIDQDACTNSNNVLTLNLHPQSSNPHLAD
ncbi:MAG TPA: hypothetical protein VG274_10745, partial [Rhizomicrobium sp.]|nr:hypothetical protein [Rhizomicrobium sp.]